MSFGAFGGFGGTAGGLSFGQKPAAQAASPFGTPGAAATPFGAPAQPAFGAAAPSGAFGGAGGAFGAAPAFGTQAAGQPAFGVAQPQQQSVFGASPAVTSGFGAPLSSAPFGTPATSATPFGQAMPSGGGLFGSPSTAQAATPSFGGFGGTASAGSAATPFGQVMGGTQSPGGMGAAQAAPPGTRGVPYCPTLQQDGAGSNTSGAPATNVAFNVITAMPAYSNKSVEELRWEDYQQGVRGGSGNVSNIAQPAGNQPGGSGTSPGGNTFGSAFGGASSSGGFGQPAGGMTPFGQQQQQQPGTSLFGQQQTQPGASPFGAASASGGAFGAKPAFGSTTPGTTAFGGAANPFGAPQQSAPAPFGQTSAATPFGQAGGATAFGSNPFGAKPQATTPFGAPQQAPTGGMFGQPQQGTTPFGTAQPGGGLFGAQQPQQQQQQQQPFGGGAFGATQPQAGGNLFGQMPGTTPGGTSLFGQAPGTGAGANPFGGGAAQPGGGLFGSTVPAAGGLFGASLTPGGQQSGGMPAFGATNTSPGTGMLGANTGGGGLFGGGAFGTAPAQGGGMFGTALPQQQQQPLGGSSLFGGGLTTPTTGGLNFGAPAGGAFGGLSNPFAAGSLTSPAPGGSMFGGMPLGGASPGLGMMGGGGMMAAPTGPPNPYGLPPARAEYLGMDAPSPGATLPPQQGAGSYTQQQQALSRSPLLLAPPPPKALQPPKSAAAVLSARRRGTMTLGASTGGMALTTSGGMGVVSPNGGAGALGMRTPSGFTVGTSSPGQAPLQLGGMMDGGGTGGGGDVGTGSPYADAFMPRDNPRALVIRSDRVAAATADLLDGAAAATPAGAGNGSTPDGTPGTRGDGHIAGGTGLFASPPPSSDRTPPKDEPHHGAANGVANGGHAARKHTAANGGGDEPHQGGGGGPPSAPLVGPSADLVPRLTLPGHFMRPSPQELAQCPRDALAAVSDFTVVRLGVAQIKWLVPVDVRGLNLDDIIRFSKRSVAVYPHDDGPLAPVKPPQGQGLNCPAEISYTNIFKLDKATGAPVQSPREVDAFKHKLRRVLAAQDGAQFVSYDADSGTWVFRVQHFSKYGLPDEDDDDDVDMGGGGDDEEDEPWGVVMAPSLPQHQQHQRAAAAPLQAQATNQLLLGDMKPVAGIMQSQALVTTARMSAAALAGAPKQPPPRAAPPLPPVYTPLAAPPPSSQPRNASVLTDAGLAMGRSFRVGWAPNGTVFYPSSDGTRVVSAPTPGWVHPAPGATLALAACMRVHRSHAEQTSVPGPDGTPVPLWRLACSADTLGALCSSYLRALDATVAAAVTACPAGPRVGAAEVAAHTQALQLVAVCHAQDPGSRAAQEESGLEAVARRAGVLAWLAEPDVTRTPGPDAAQFKAAHAPCGPALDALAAGRTADAVAACVASGDPRHATLVAQTGGAGSLRQLLTQQLHQHGTGHIAPGRALLLRLLSGDVTAGGKGLTPHWKAAVLLHARLGADPAQPLAHVLAAYEAGVAAGQAPAPVPGYPGPRGGAVDVGYALLKHSCRPDGSFGPPGDAASLTQVVTPAGYTQRPWNAAPGWHLGSTLLAPVTHSSNNTAAVLSCAAYDAASQLCGCPELVPWAVYACLTMGDAPAAAAAAAQAILCRYWPAIAAQPGGVAFLINRVCVPAPWLAAAAGLWAKHSTFRGDAPSWWPLLNAEEDASMARDAHYPGETHGTVEPALVAVAHALRSGGDSSVETVFALPSRGATPSQDVCAYLDGVACGAS